MLKTFHLPDPTRPWQRAAARVRGRALLVATAFLLASGGRDAAAQGGPSNTGAPAPGYPTAPTSTPSTSTPPMTPPTAEIAPQPAAPDVSSGSGVAVHATVSQGFMLTTGNDYILTDTTHGSFQLSELGVNLTKEITDNLRIGAQAFAQNLGMGGNFNLRADWYYLDYRPRDWFGLRFGRLQIPFGLYNEFNDIDAARAPILLPQSVYPLQGRNFLFAQTGFEVYGFLRSASAGALEYRLYMGTIFIDPAILIPPGAPIELKLNVRYVAGGRLFWETPVERLRVGVSVLAIQLDVTAFGEGMSVDVRNRSLLAMGSAEYGTGPLMLSAEYALWHTHQDSVLAPSNFTTTSERAYAMATYRLTPWLQPALYYGLYFPDIDHRDGGSAFRQDDVSFTLRFDVNSHWSIKGEGHYMSGTAGLVNPLSISAPLVNPTEHWGVFLLKTTGYF